MESLICTSFLLIIIDNLISFCLIYKKINSLEESIKNIDKQLRNITPDIYTYNWADLDDIDKNVKRILDRLDAPYFERVKENLKNLKS